jgi:hypothetical protein
MYGNVGKNWTISNAAKAPRHEVLGTPYGEKLATDYTDLHPTSPLATPGRQIFLTQVSLITRRVQPQMIQQLPQNFFDS